MKKRYIYVKIIIDAFIFKECIAKRRPEKMKTNGIGKRIIIFTLIAVIVLTMQGTRVFAESLQPESRSETSAEQPEIQPETTGEESVSQNDLPEEEQESRSETTEDESVSQNDLPEEEEENQPEEGQSEATEEESVSGNDLSELRSVNQPATAAEQTYPELTNAILKKCKVKGTNPPGVTVNLFDYWQDKRGEIAHDQLYGPQVWHTYEMGISKGHLLRFGYKSVGCDYCDAAGDFGAWNNSITGGPCQGIVKNKLGAYGYPILDFNTKSDEEFGGYAKLDDSEKEEYLSKKEESLAYLFSPSVRLPDYKATYGDVRGLFQTDEDGYYYYNSTENFASYNKATNSFILYNSPGVAEANGANEKSIGQFFPFNTAKDVFDTYTTDANGNYRLCYMDKKNDSNGDPKSYDYPIKIKDNSYLYCSATRLNHFLGMTLEFYFEQPENGRWSNGKPMTFEFSGDDDVWIFIDGVLVADLGGLHDSCSLKIDFSTGEVNVAGEQHTLLDSFNKAYGEDSELDGIEFRDNTFADSTEHKLKMFYLERGHGASDLALKFNVMTISDEPVKKDPPDEDPNEIETPPNEDTDENKESASDIISVSDNRMVLDTAGIPRTGDDSRIGWLSALCIISLSGIGVSVCNLILVRRKQRNHSLKQ